MNTKDIQRINDACWVEEYIVPKNLDTVEVEHFKRWYNQYYIDMVKKLHKAVNNDDWRRVGQLIGGLDIDMNMTAGNNEWYSDHLRFFTYNLLWENLFFVAYQRILQLNFSSRATALSLEFLFQKFKKLVKTDTYKVRKLLPLFHISVLIYAVAHDNYQSTLSILRNKIEPKYNETDINENIGIYKLFIDYKSLQEEDDEVDTAPMMRALFESMCDCFETTTKNPVTLLLLYEPFIRVAAKVEEKETALEVLVHCSKQSESIVPYVTSILARCNQLRMIGRYLKECIENNPKSSFLHRFPLMLHYVGQNSLQSVKNESFSYEKTEKYVRILFDFLDSGKNRTHGEAWLAFRINLELIKPLPQWVYDEWNERADWWPRFHRNPLEEFQAERQKVFAMFERGRKRKIC